MVFVFSLEDEISFQTVYNYYLRLCSYRNTAEVPMVLGGPVGAGTNRGVVGTAGLVTEGSGKGAKPDRSQQDP